MSLNIVKPPGLAGQIVRLELRDHLEFDIPVDVAFWSQK